jgi:hypothetical protein
MLTVVRHVALPGYAGGARWLEVAWTGWRVAELQVDKGEGKHDGCGPRGALPEPLLREHRQVPPGPAQAIPFPLVLRLKQTVVLPSTGRHHRPLTDCQQPRPVQLLVVEGGAGHHILLLPLVLVLMTRCLLTLRQLP